MGIQGNVTIFFSTHPLTSAQKIHRIFLRFPAVAGLSFGVKHGECFGLLGINGAGKTTSFR